jgi:hypothetical protein
MPVPGLTGFMPQTAVPAGPQVYINPASRFDNHAGGPFYAEGNFTLVSNVGVPTAYVWSIIAGTGTVQAGQGTATATIRTTGACVIRCKATIGGGDYNPEASLTYEPGEVDPGDGGGGHGGGGGLEVF